MRQELRRKLPRTQGCGWALGIGILAVVGILAFLAVKWGQVAFSPSGMVQKVMTRARSRDLEGMKKYLTKDSLEAPGCQAMLESLQMALGSKALLDQQEVVGEEATVHVSLLFKSVTGRTERLDLPVATVKQQDRGWLIDLEKTVTALSGQEWQALAAQRSQ